MLLKGLLTESFADLFSSRIFSHFQQFIIKCSIDFIFRLTFIIILRLIVVICSLIVLILSIIILPLISIFFLSKSRDRHQPISLQYNDDRIDSF